MHSFLHTNTYTHTHTHSLASLTVKRHPFLSYLQWWGNGCPRLRRTCHHSPERYTTIQLVRLALIRLVLERHMYVCMYVHGITFFKYCDRWFNLKQVLRRGANVNDRDDLTDLTLLHYACKSGAGEWMYVWVGGCVCVCVYLLWWCNLLLLILNQEHQLSVVSIILSTCHFEVCIPHLLY